MKSSAVRKDGASHHHSKESGTEVMSESTESRIIRIESDVHYIKEDTADLRVELHHTNDKIDVTNKRIEEVRDSLTTKMDVFRDDLTGRINDVRDDLTGRIDGVREDLTGRIDGVREDLTGRINDVRDDLTSRIDGVRDDLTGRIDGLKEKLHSLTIWALLLYFTLAGGLLTVIARAFKWI
jgi:archaellum component FlaC